MRIIQERIQKTGLWNSIVEQELISLWKYGVLRISDSMIRKSIIDFLSQEAPLGFFVNPASVSGKWHPKWQNEKCGILRNTTECCLFADQMLMQYQEFCDTTHRVLPEARDIVLCATILSDTFKYGTLIVEPHSDKAKHIREHGQVAADKWWPIAYATCPLNPIKEIYDSTYWHLGRWTPGWTPGVKFSKLTEIVHILDAIFADKNLELLYEVKQIVG